MNWCILIPLLVGLICALLGYLLGKLLSGESNNHDSASINMWRDKNAQLEADLKACKSKLTTKVVTPKVESPGVVSSFAGAATTNVNAVAATITKSADLPFDAVAAKAAFGKTIKRDDLKVVEGIGPKIEEVFKNAGVTSWRLLAESTATKLKEILDAEGERFKVHNPETWPMQSKMAYEGDWAVLKKWQDEHDYGKK